MKYIENILENVPVIALTVMIGAGFAMALMFIIAMIFPPQNYEDVLCARRYAKWMAKTMIISLVTLILWICLY